MANYERVAQNPFCQQAAHAPYLCTMMEGFLDLQELTALMDQCDIWVKCVLLSSAIGQHTASLYVSKLTL